MATTKELNVEDKLRAIYDLQIIDTRIDEIRNVRGELPLEVEDLEDEVAGLSTRLDKLKNDLLVIEEQIKSKKNAIDDHQAAIKKYEVQQKEVRNNREFNSLTKEVEFQELEIQLADYFKNPFQFEGPGKMSEDILFEMPNGEVKKISVNPQNFKMKIINNSIIVTSDLLMQAK